jgi:proteasome accessory factor C
MLAVVPYLVRHQGSELAEVARAFSVPPDQLRRDLDLLFLSGLPPYGPGDLIDVDVDEDDRVWISMADHFSRPLRLTRQEALAVYVRGTELLATPGLPQAPALANALGKLRTSLGDAALGHGIESAAAGTAPPHLELLRSASRDRLRLSIEYLAASTRERTTRRIEPEEVFSSLGNWYVAAWDLDVEGERLFRADRILAARTTGDRFEPRGLEGAGRALYTPTDEDMPVRLVLDRAARWVAEYYVTTEQEEHDDGSVEVTLPSRRLGWVALLLLRLGTHARVLDPPALADMVRDLGKRTLDRYGAAGSDVTRMV